MRLFVLLVSIFIFSCAGSRGTLKFDNVNYPMSLNQWIFNKDGQKVSIGNGLVQTGSLSEYFENWAFFYHWYSISNEKIFYTKIENSIRQKRGDGLVNTFIVIQDCFYNNLLFLNYLPIWPGCSTVYIEGDIVKFQDIGGTK